jgi:hypothetical protein
MFDVNMPLLCGEGNRAFTRLLEEIIKGNCDLGIFAWKSVARKDNEYGSRYSEVLA